METIKGAVDSASKVLFGDQHAKHGEQGQHVEPQSGVTGNTTRGEPYDGGNLDQSNPGNIAGQGYTKQDDAHAFQTSHEIPRGEGVIGSSHTHTGTGSSLTGGYGGSSNAGPHDSNVANKLDPRVDSDRDGRSGVTGSSQTGTGSGLTGGYDGSSNAGPHDSNILNKADPRVDSDRDGRSGLTGSSHTGTGSGLTGGHGGSSNAGPHASNVANKVDPRVDSDRDGRSGVTGSSHTGTTGGDLMGSSRGFGSSNAGPHDSNLANKADPRVDSDRDGRSGVSGQHNTPSQGGIGATISKAAAAVTGGAVGGAAAQHQARGTDYDNRGTSGNNNLTEYSMDQATQHAESQQHGQPHISDSSYGGGQRHQGANDPTDQPSHHESHAIRDTKNEAERKLDPSNTSASHGPQSSSGVVGQDSHSVRQGSLTGHLPGAPGGEGLQRTTGEGTGKQYVKSSGLAAEGGDFDASRPGAGKEADRLLEEHGIHHGEDKHVGHGQDEPSSKMAGGHTTTGTHSHGAHTGTPGTLGAHDQHDRHTTPSSTTGVHDGVTGTTGTTGTHTSTAGAPSGTHGTHDTTATHSGTHGEGPLHADLKGVRHEKAHGHDGVYGTVAEGTTDEKPSLKDKIKAKIHMS